MPAKPRILVLAAAIVAVALLATPALVGCGAQSPPAAQSNSPAAGAAEATSPTPPDQTEESSVYTPSYRPNGKEIAVIETNRGVIEVKLYGKEAPINTANFIELAQKGFYDKVKFHRLEPGFVIQGGDPQTITLSSKEVVELIAKQNSGSYEQGAPMLGAGGPGYTIKGEFNPGAVPHPHVDGSLAMARSDSPDSAGSQFYFTLGPQSFLDGKYTVFGDTVKGLSVIHKLEVGDVIKSVTIENVTK